MRAKRCGGSPGTLSQSSGPDGTRVTVTVTGGAANAPVTVSIDGWPMHTGTDANGRYTGRETMGGFPGDVKTITVQIRNANGVVETVTTRFTITEPANRVVNFATPFVQRR